jgi:hypothetical protein
MYVILSPKTADATSIPELEFAQHTTGDAVMLTRELEFFKANQEELVAKHKGQHLVIVGETVVGAYDSPLSAYTAALENYEPGSFMIQVCQPGPSAYTVTIASAGLVEFCA